MTVILLFFCFFSCRNAVSRCCCTVVALRTTRLRNRSSFASSELYPTPKLSISAEIFHINRNGTWLRSVSAKFFWCLEYCKALNRGHFISSFAVPFVVKVETSWSLLQIAFGILVTNVTDVINTICEARVFTTPNMIGRVLWTSQPKGRNRQPTTLPGSAFA